MALIFGVFSSRGALDAAAVQPMLADFADQGQRRLQQRVYPGALLAAASPPGDGPVFSGEAHPDRPLAALVGTLTGLAPGAVPAAEPGPPTPAQALLAGLNDFHHHRLAQSEGAFCAVHYDPQAHRLLLANDKFGLRPLFVATAGDLLAFCSEYQPLLKLPGLAAQIDTDALAEYFALGTTLGDKTLLRGIRNLTPGSVLQATAGGVRQRRYWLPQIAVDHGATVEQHARAVADTLLQATREIADSQPGLMCLLSAGADSRLILSSLTPAQRQRLHFFTSNLSVLAPEDDKDVIGATQLAQALGLDHEVKRLAYAEIEFGPGYFDRERRLRPATVLGGWHGGELLGGCCWGAAPISPTLTRAEVDARLSAVFSPGFLIGLNHHPWDSYQAELDQLPAENRLFLSQIGQLTRGFFSHTYLGSRGQWLQPFQIINHGHSPFWDSRFLQALLRVPFGMVEGYGLYNVIFRDLLPELRHIPSNSVLTRRADTALSRMSVGQEPKAVLQPNQVAALAAFAADPTVWQRGDYAASLTPLLSDIGQPMALKFVDFEAWRARHLGGAGPATA